MFEYIVTIFKVVVGVITNERLVIASLIALGLLLLWIVFSLCFSFEMRFLSGARKINKYISRNGIAGAHKQGLANLVQKMPSEFIRGYHTYEKNPHSLPSEYIKRSDCLDLELNGGVFNQNRSIIKSYINTVFFALLVFSFAIMSSSSLFDSGSATSETALTGYMVAEAMLIPFLFLLVAKGMYYIYTAIRQHQYHVAVEEFNEMIDNFDKEALDTYGYIPASLTTTAPLAKQEPFANVAPAVAPAVTKIEEPTVEPVQHEEPVVENIKKPAEETLYEPEVQEEPIGEIQEIEETEEPATVQETAMVEENVPYEKSEEQESETQKPELYALPEQEDEPADYVDESVEDKETDMAEETEPEDATFEENTVSEEDEEANQIEQDLAEESASEYEEKPEEVQEEQFDNESAEPDNFAEDENSIDKEAESTKEENYVEGIDKTAEETENNNEDNTVENNEEIKDNFKPDFASLLGENAQKKRGRGRPKKETNSEEGFTIKTDKDFEEALIRAEKLMRKNEEPLSASQTKRIEKQLKELIDAMSKYKENK